MTAATERLRELVDSYDPPDLPPLSAELVRTLGLPADLPAELAIGEVAEATGISAHTLRYYERIGLVEVGRDTGGWRAYDPEALARVVFVTRATSGCPRRRRPRSAARSRCTRSPRSKPSGRCSAVTSRMPSCRPAANWASGWFPTARSAGGC